MPAKPRRPRDPIKLAELIGDMTTGQAAPGPPATGPLGITPTTYDPPPDYEGKHPAAVALGRLGGLKGGKARAKALSSRRRKAIAQKAAKARWRKQKSC